MRESREVGELVLTPSSTPRVLAYASGNVSVKRVRRHRSTVLTYCRRPFLIGNGRSGVLMGMRAGLLLVAAVLLVGCGSSSSCKSLGGQCAINADCCDANATCVQGACSSCGVAGAACNAMSDCCTSIGIGCQLGLCAKCGVTGQACKTTADCCGGPTIISELVCDRLGKKCVEGKNLNIGQTCDDNSQCASGNCTLGYCTKSCLSNQSCQAGVSFCESVDDTCCPFCGSGSNTDCSVYGSGLTCQNVATVNGTTLPCCEP